MVRKDNLMGLTWGPTNQGGMERDILDESYITFGVNHTLLTPSFVTHKFKRLILKKKLDP